MSMSSAERAELENFIARSGEVALNCGLKPPEIHFEIVSSQAMYERAAYHFPVRFPHWTNGSLYHRMKTRYDCGLEKIYELVLNTEPCQAYLMETNQLIEQKLVVAHVLGHADFFRRNDYFRETDRQMAETARRHAGIIMGSEDEYGLEPVEETLDAALAIALHVDPTTDLFRQKVAEEYERERLHPPEEPRSEYDDIWNLTAGSRLPEPVKKPRKIPPEPERDLLGFLAQHSPQLEDWQRVILWIVRDEWRYFYPNMRTKIMNEGYASFWHERILENIPLTPDEHIRFRQMHSGLVSAGHRFAINPYMVGYKIWRDIENRWEEPEEEQTWYGETFKRKGGEGLQKVFEVAAQCRDSEFARNFLTKKLVEELDLYVYGFSGDKKKKQGDWVVEEEQWQGVRDALVNDLMSPVPAILVIDGDFRRQGELLLKHDFGSDGKSLDLDYARRTLGLVHKLWGNPVSLETAVENKKMRFRFDGQDFKQEQI